MEFTTCQPSQPVLLRVTEAARLLGLGRSTVYALVATGELKSVTFGRKARRIPVAAVDALVEARLRSQEARA